MDEQLALFVVNSHMRSHPGYNKQDVEMPPPPPPTNDSGLEPIEQEILRKYIVYAKTFVKPRLQEVDKERVSTF
jgi:DNA replication licensing factor MCM2